MCKWAGMERPCHVHARRLVPHESAEAGVVGHPCLQGWEIQQTPRSAADALPCGVQRKGQPSPRVASTWQGLCWATPPSHSLRMRARTACSREEAGRLASCGSESV